MVELIGKMFNRGSNSFALNKQSTVSYHGRTPPTSEHLFLLQQPGCHSKVVSFFSSKPLMGALKLITTQCITLGEPELVISKQVRGTCHNSLNKEYNHEVKLSVESVAL